MLSAGTQASFSSNWKPALVGSKSIQSSSEIRKVTSEVDQRGAAAVAVDGLLRAVDDQAEERAHQRQEGDEGKDRPARHRAYLHEQHEVGDEAGHADQHREGVVVEVAALEAAQHAGEVRGARGDAVGPEPVDRWRRRPSSRSTRPIASAGLDEQRVIELVEVPLVEKKRVAARWNARASLRRQVGTDDVEEVAQRDAADAPRPAAAARPRSAPRACGAGSSSVALHGDRHRPRSAPSPRRRTSRRRRCRRRSRRPPAHRAGSA